MNLANSDGRWLFSHKFVRSIGWSSKVANPMDNVLERLVPGQYSHKRSSSQWAVSGDVPVEKMAHICTLLEMDFPKNVHLEVPADVREAMNERLINGRNSTTTIDEKLKELKNQAKPLKVQLDAIEADIATLKRAKELI